MAHMHCCDLACFKAVLDPCVFKQLTWKRGTVYRRSWTFGQTQCSRTLSMKKQLMVLWTVLTSSLTWQAPDSSTCSSSFCSTLCPLFPREGSSRPVNGISLEWLHLPNISESNFKSLSVSDTAVITARDICLPCMQVQDQVKTFPAGEGEVIPGITTFLCPYHTPGHVAFMLSPPDGDPFVYVGDCLGEESTTINNQCVSNCSSVPGKSLACLCTIDGRSRPST